MSSRPVRSTQQLSDQPRLQQDLSQSNQKKLGHSPAHLRAEKTVPNQPISQKTQQALGGACNPIKKAENKTLNQRLVWGRPLLTSTWKAEEDPSLELRHSSLVKTQLGESGKMAQ